MRKKKENRGGARAEAGRRKIDKMEKKHTVTMQVALKHIDNISTMPESDLIDLSVSAIESKRNKLVNEGLLDEQI